MFLDSDERTLLHNGYYAVQDENGNFIGALEVTQDIAEVRSFKSEK